MTTSLTPIEKVRWHRPLLWFAAAMLLLTIVCVVGFLVDPRHLLGVSVWEKPGKFAISTAIYAVTWSWLIGQLNRSHRLAWWAGTASAALLAIEMVVIVGASAAGMTSHFNVSSVFSTVLWSIMAFSITALWVATLVVSIILFRNPLGDRARTFAIRSGAVLALVGMGLAFLMTGPNADQLNDFQGVAGAHTVGLLDGGPGLPFLGWSTVAGDLRIPHFIGMHALQIIPLALVALELLARRVPRLCDVTVRFRLLVIVAVTYSAVLALVTWQALRGQSIVQPDALTLVISAAIAVAALVAAAAVLLKTPGLQVEGLPSVEGEELATARDRDRLNASIGHLAADD